jgi:hypothetical protein
VTNSGTAAVPPATTSSAVPVKPPVGGVARHHDMSHKVGRQASPPGYNKATCKVHLAKANLANAKGRAKDGLKHLARLKQILKLN